jgi:hypothetical protein
MMPADLIAARRALGLTQTALAHALQLRGRGLRSVQRWEAPGGEVPGPVQVAVELMVRRDRDPRIVAWLRAQATAFSADEWGTAFDYAADEIERGVHATAPAPDRPEHPPAPAVGFPAAR